MPLSSCRQLGRIRFATSHDPTCQQGAAPPVAASKRFIGMITNRFGSSETVIVF